MFFCVPETPYKLFLLQAPAQNKAKYSGESIFRSESAGLAISASLASSRYTEKSATTRFSGFQFKSLLEWKK